MSEIGGGGRDRGENAATQVACGDDERKKGWVGSSMSNVMRALGPGKHA